MRDIRPLPDPLGDEFLTYRLTLTRGYEALVDWKHRIAIRSLSWCVHIRPAPCKLIYVMGNMRGSDGKRRPIYLHRWLTNAPTGADVDHINRNGLDNRLANLRIVTRAQNCVNMTRTASQHGFHGIARSGGLYYGRMAIDGRKYCTRGYNAPEDAARAWDEMAVSFHGEEYIDLNFPAQAEAA